MAANGFSARKSNVREKLSDLFYSVLSPQSLIRRAAHCISLAAVAKVFFLQSNVPVFAINSLERILPLI